jgi:hypothetical protein
MDTLTLRLEGRMLYEKSWGVNTVIHEYPIGEIQQKLVKYLVN